MGHKDYDRYDLQGHLSARYLHVLLTSSTISTAQLLSNCYARSSRSRIKYLHNKLGRRDQEIP